MAQGKALGKPRRSCCVAMASVTEYAWVIMLGFTIKAFYWALGKKLRDYLKKDKAPVFPLYHCPPPHHSHPTPTSSIIRTPHSRSTRPRSRSFHDAQVHLEP
jgi:hypothetical protein